MRRFTSILALVALCTCIKTAPVSAQSRTAAAAPQQQPRVRAMINGGYQPSTTSFDDSFTFTLYLETGTTETTYSVEAGGIFEGGGCVRLVKGLAIGGVISHFTADSTASVTSSVPHPFFLNAHRQVTGDAQGLRREETAVHIQAQYLLPFGRLNVVLAGGPTIIDVKQSLVVDVKYSEEFPYDEAVFTGVDSKRGTGTATGFNAGVDVQWMFNPRLGVGGLVRFTKATVDVTVDNRTIQMDAGGLQVGGGIRLAF